MDHGGGPPQRHVKAPIGLRALVQPELRTKALEWAEDDVAPPDVAFDLEEETTAATAHDMVDLLADRLELFLQPRQLSPVPGGQIVGRVDLAAVGWEVASRLHRQLLR